MHMHVFIYMIVCCAYDSLFDSHSVSIDGWSCVTWA